VCDQSSDGCAVRTPAERADRHDSFERLFDEHYRAVCGYARRRASAGEADDVVADTFLIAWRRLEEIPPAAKPWLLGVARRVLANQRRAASRRAALTERVAIERNDSLELERPPILRAVAHLPAGDREVLLLSAWDGLSTDETAAALGCSRTAAKVRLHRARRRLRAELERLDRDERAPTATGRLEKCHDE
jgi:RNA polymerase sigma-70 factor (ECF subfamily)